MFLQSIEKTNKSFMLAIDAGPSMQHGDVLGCELISPLIASAAVTMTYLRSEPNCQVVGIGSMVEPLDIRAHSSLTDICTSVSRVCAFFCSEARVWVSFL